MIVVTVSLGLSERKGKSKLTSNKKREKHLKTPEIYIGLYLYKNAEAYIQLSNGCDH